MAKKLLQSKTKIGSLLAGGAIIAGALGAWIEGAMDAPTVIKTVAIGLGVVYFGVGLRDAIKKD